MSLFCLQEFFWGEDSTRNPLPSPFELFSMLTNLRQRMAEADFAGGFRGAAELPMFKRFVENVRLDLSFLLDLFAKPKSRIILLEQIVATCPQGFWYLWLGQDYQAAGDLVRAEEAFRLAMETPSLGTPKRRALYDLVQVQLERAKHANDAVQKKELQDRALANLRRVLVQGPLPKVALGELAATAYGAGDFVLAHYLFDEYNRQSSNERVGLIWQMSVETKLGDYGRALKTVDEYWKKPTAKNHTEHGNIVVDRKLRAEYELGHYERALATAQEALTKNAKSTEANGIRAALAQRLRELHAIVPIVEVKLQFFEPLRLARSGESAKAAAEVEKLARGSAGNSAILYVQACVYALSAAANPQALPSSSAVSSSTERDAATAVAFLRKASAAGFFTTRAHVEHMKQDPDLDALRNRDDFKALLMELEKKPIPPPP